MIWFLGYSKEWRTLRNSKGFFGKTLSEMKRGWEVERVCICSGRRMSKLIEIFLPQPELFSHYLSAAGGWMNSASYALSDKASVIFARLTVQVTSDDKLEKLIFWKPEFKSGFGSWFLQSSKPHVTSDDTSGQFDRLVILSNPSFWERSSAFEKRIRLFWIKKIWPFDLREGASSICKQTRLRSQRSASQFLLFIEARILLHITLELLPANTPLLWTLHLALLQT